jgi:hypothetical protein
MTPILRSARIAALVATGLLAGCFESDFPLDPSPPAAVDAALVGSWRCLELGGKADEAITIVVRAAQDRRYDVSWQSAGGGRPDLYRAHGSSVRVPGLLNIQPVRDGAAQGAWVFHRYTFLRPHVVQLQFASKKVLEGVEKSPGALRAAIERLQGDPTLFTDFVVCARANDPK